jgi:hypothetical protein
MSGIGWREHVWPKLTLVGKSARPAAWAADATTLGRIVGEAITTSVLCAGGSPDAAIAPPDTTNYVSWLERVESSVPGKPPGVSLKPVTDALETGTSVEAAFAHDGKRTTFTAKLHDTRLVRFHTAPVSESIPRPNGPATVLRATMQVPEVAESSAEGTWAVDRGQALVISLGVYSHPDGLRERLVVLDALDLDESAVAAGKALTIQTQTVVKKQSMLSYALGKVGVVGGIVLALVLLLTIILAGALDRTRPERAED